jgi:hypothetical protein
MPTSTRMWHTRPVDVAVVGDATSGEQDIEWVRLAVRQQLRVPARMTRRSVRLSRLSK